MVLFSVVTTRRHEVEWVTEGLRRLFPAQWERFSNGVPPGCSAKNIVEAYSEMLEDPDPAVRDKAARDWCDWEEAHVAVVPGHRPDPRYDDPLVTHYWRHAAFLEDGILLREVRKLAGIPGVLVQGRLDVSSPLDVPWELANRWPGCRLVVVEQGGHSTGPGMREVLVRATDHFSRDTDVGGL
jgi:proline iminopeptidase